MPIQTFETRLPASAEDLFAWHARTGAFERLAPPWQPIRLDRSAPLADGSVAHLRMKKGPFWFRWTAEHRDVVPNRGFVDVQTAGPFARWEHQHSFEPRGEGPHGEGPHSEGPNSEGPNSEGAVLRDRIEYALPGGAVGQALAGAQVERDIESTFAYRHETTARDLARGLARH